MDPQNIYYLVAALLVVAGLAGTVLPVLPGVPLMFSGMLLGAWAGNFEQVGGWVIAVLGVLTALSIIVDLLASAMGAKRVGASRLALLGAVVGTLAGMFFGILGLLAGPFVGALVGELMHGRQVRHATRVGFGTWLGILVGTVLKIGLAFAMVGIFAFAWFI